MKMSRGKREGEREGGTGGEKRKKNDRQAGRQAGGQAAYPEFLPAERAAFVRVSADAPDTLASASSVNRLARRANQMRRDS